MPRNYATLAGVLFFGQVRNPGKGGDMNRTFRRLLRKDEGQDIAEYAVLLAVILSNRAGHYPADRIQYQHRLFAGCQFDSLRAARVREGTPFGLWPVKVT